ncbi:hypothetical protein GGX14DRAFT_143245 [Mycena pura]|uniref:Ricin B lectin domain-containing protein n=1 Tax=Mycena pura TaxID=153505 RepID=A0AAD6V8H7_9AGAR|nr:hypothetical protein GGX14DRAFT_143245 [Mycena pura]
MFSKIFTLGLAALTLVGAAPATGFQSPMGISCSINVQAGTGATGSAGAYSDIGPGRYLILDFPRNTQLRSYTEDDPVFVSLTREFPGPFGEWDLRPASEGAFIISNVGLHSPVYAGDERTIIAGHARPAVPFAVQAAGDGTFVVKSVNEDLLWTRTTPNNVRSEVQLRPADGGDAQRWRFLSIDN